MVSAENLNIVSELEAFLKELEDYQYYRLLHATGELKKGKLGEALNLRNILVRKAAQFRALITDLTGKERITITRTKNGHESSYDIWFIGLQLRFNERASQALSYSIDITNAAIGKLKVDIEMGIRDKQGNVIGKPQKLSSEPPKAFIAHGGDSPALRKLKNFLEALGVQPLIVEEQPSEGRSVGENVDWYSRQADCAIILATKGDIDGKTGGFIPRGNVLMEIGKLQELFKDRIIYLLQAGTKFPTNVSEKVWGRFTSSQMDNAFIKIAKELKKFEILKAVKP